LILLEMGSTKRISMARREKVEKSLYF